MVQVTWARQVAGALWERRHVTFRAANSVGGPYTHLPTKPWEARARQLTLTFGPPTWLPWRAKFGSWMGGSQFAARFGLARQPRFQRLPRSVGRRDAVFVGFATAVVLASGASESGAGLTGLYSVRTTVT